MATPLSFRNSGDSVERGGFRLERFDFGTLLLTAALVGVGLISIYSATYRTGGGMSAPFVSQLIFAIIGTVVMLSVAFMPTRWLQMGAYPFYGFTLLMLVAVLIVGTVIHGQRCWIVLGPISIQPSEIAKLGTLLAAGMFLQSDRVDLRNWRSLLLLLLFFIVPVALIMRQPDAGSATVFMALFMGLALWAGADLFLLFAVAAPVVVALTSLFGELKGAGQLPFYIALVVVLGGLFLFRRPVLHTVIAFAITIAVGFSAGIVYDKLPDHQRNRIQTFLDPNLDPKGKGYHVLQSLMAVGSGGMTGKGFLHGTQTHLQYIPEQSTDFIFSVPTEEFGFVGGVIVILLQAGLIWSAVSTANQLRNKFESSVCIGIATIFLYHMSINIGMAIGLVPVMGIPLPFLSKGGSSLALNMLMVGLLMNFYRSRLDVTRREEREIS